MKKIKNFWGRTRQNTPIGRIKEALASLLGQKWHLQGVGVAKP
jgi:hypothetical protein